MRATSVPRVPMRDVTLVTGDVVHWTDAGGHRAATVEDKGAPSTFETIESDDDNQVMRRRTVAVEMPSWLAIASSL